MTEAIQRSQDHKEMSILEELEELCPCGSGKLIDDCCNKDNY